MKLHLPLVGWIVYHFMVLLLVFFGPIHWDISNPGSLIAFIVLGNILFLIGYFYGLSVQTQWQKFDLTLLIFKIGSVLTILLLLPSLHYYTGKGLLDIYSAVFDQGETWQQAQSHLRTNPGNRTWFAALRGVLAPFTLAVVPVYFLRFWELSRIWRTMGLLAICCIVLFSFARGTDKETIELGLLTGFGIFAYFVTKVNINKKNIVKPALATLMIVLVAFSAAYLFSVRKNSRLGEMFVYCQSNTKVCADYDHPTLSWLPDNSKGSAAIIVNYLSQGHYGLSLGLKHEFESTYGIGHSRFLTTQFSRLFPNSDFLDRSYSYKIDADGWPYKYAWSTAYVAIANDFGFLGATLIICLFGFLFALAWKDFIVAGNFHAYLFLVCCVLTMFYMPMNFQLTQTIDNYFPAVVWLGLWLFSRMPRRS